MVLAQVGKNSYVACHAFHFFEGYRVSRHLHNHIPDFIEMYFVKQLVQINRVGRGESGFYSALAYPYAVWTDNRGFLAGFL